ncbi:MULTISPECIES: hypothetical protein [Deinococcus]|uniref:Uncharacterized protein n=1 Tax=Deinococcus rufus TaxID=2136097 RepID=A0ABV7Z8J0_9DEIO|nr:hypothetical protein [Deinococcus sp. AB2017081]WQE97132.1 hypothetical protein U2P90_18830 [Deinococcus sp. AB2017081]
MSGEPLPEALESADARRTLREILEACRVVTGPQLQRWGLEAAARELELTHASRTVRTRTTQPHSAVPIRFVVLEPYWLRRSARELMHWAATAELFVANILPPTGRWTLVDSRSGQRGHYPDAEFIMPVNGLSAAFEVDAGYAPAKVEAKLLAYAGLGYSTIMWGVTIHARVPTVARMATELMRTHRLPGVTLVISRYINFWDVRDPYHDRRRCHKPMKAAVALPDAEVQFRAAYATATLEARPWLKGRTSRST